ncbi:MAG: low affinity Fe/Cu permease [Gammaproteobacteria bacterium]|jgi:low affinity Fe/Cu permease
MTGSSRQIVNGLLVNNAVGLDRQKRDQIRAIVHKLEQEYKMGAHHSDVFEHNWRKAACSVGRLKRGNPTKHANLRTRLEQIKH